ncbi:uncharacterized protein LY89DRAFT_731656 [Mollisia scopiformis]|uniref:Uncharacterized protein n=1 Tax=Mollisia scopiformis TaxID=149040 RepID=A0A194XGF4_MOLSC|nr:uncharacterized protein LY89DRAFT_731656 [Mollisia scopiformis]KUJ19248.1 hypothetical protein LY89DRAFT_731656 [Mollisia scopiformis]
MGSCMTRLKAEMVAPPSNSGNWEGLAPQRPQAYAPREPRQRQQMEKDTNGVLLGRRETASGIPGLTYDHAGRPVWREENAIRVEHRENR